MLMAPSYYVRGAAYVYVYIRLPGATTCHSCRHFIFICLSPRVEVTEVDLGLDSGAFSSNLSPNKGMDADDVGMLSSAQA